MDVQLYDTPGNEEKVKRFVSVGAYVIFLLCQSPFSLEIQGKSLFYRANFPHTEKIASETPLFKIFGVWGNDFFL